MGTSKANVEINAGGKTGAPWNVGFATVLSILLNAVTKLAQQSPSSFSRSF